MTFAAAALQKLEMKPSFKGLIDQYSLTNVTSANLQLGEKR